MRVFSGLMAAAVALMSSPALADTTIIHAGAVLTDADSRPSGPATITVTDGKIVSIVDGFSPTPEGATMVHLDEHTVMPGLIDLHTHLSGDPGGDFRDAAVNPAEWYSFVAAKNARITALAGFTTIRDLGARSDQVMQSLRRATAEGFVPGPRIIASTRTIAIVGGHGDTNGFNEHVNDALDNDFSCTGPIECSEKVRLASKYGADLIKITATGGVLSQQGDCKGGQFIGTGGCGPRTRRTRDRSGGKGRRADYRAWHLY